MAGRVRRVLHQGPGRGGQAVGDEEVQAAHELRQAESRAQVRHIGCFYIFFVFNLLTTNAVSDDSEQAFPNSTLNRPLDRNE